MDPFQGAQGHGTLPEESKSDGIETQGELSSLEPLARAIFYERTDDEGQEVHNFQGEKVTQKKRKMKVPLNAEMKEEGSTLLGHSSTARCRNSSSCQ